MQKLHIDFGRDHNDNRNHRQESARQAMNVCINVALRHVHVTIVAVEKQYYLF
jgi:hypothetical protein